MHITKSVGRALHLSSCFWAAAWLFALAGQAVLHLPRARGFVPVPLAHKVLEAMAMGVPVAATEATFNAIRHGIKDGMLVMDVGSTKRDVVAAARQALGDKRGIGRYGFLLPMDEARVQVAPVNGLRWLCCCWVELGPIPYHLCWAATAWLLPSGGLGGWGWLAPESVRQIHSSS